MRSHVLCFNRLNRCTTRIRSRLARCRCREPGSTRCKNNDLMPDDAGIRIAYRFASPNNRAATGDLERFIALLKNPLYAPLIGFDRAELGQAHIALGLDEAWQQVWIVRRIDGTAGFRWVLSRPQRGDFAGCWLVDAVVRTK
ncbi:MAG: DUF4864 domain-containing protein [Chloroflexi bacterium]|nr:DUF4864 domain-containing protein [Chloroflexota bacterium]